MIVLYVRRSDGARIHHRVYRLGLSSTLICIWGRSLVERSFGLIYWMPFTPSLLFSSLLVRYHSPPSLGRGPLDDCPPQSTQSVDASPPALFVPCSPLFPSRTTTFISEQQFIATPTRPIGYCRTRALLIPFFYISVHRRICSD